jgi:hypothetical protein
MRLRGADAQKIHKEARKPGVFSLMDSWIPHKEVFALPKKQMDASFLQCCLKRWLKK